MFIATQRETGSTRRKPGEDAGNSRSVAFTDVMSSDVVLCKGDLYLHLQNFKEHPFNCTVDLKGCHLLCVWDVLGVLFISTSLTTTLKGIYPTCGPDSRQVMKIKFEHRSIKLQSPCLSHLAMLPPQTVLNPELSSEHLLSPEKILMIMCSDVL